jgi:putative acetyltransferase
VAIACGALKRDAGGIGEVKRIYTRPRHRGRRIGEQILARIEAMAQEVGAEAARTGDR